MFYFHLRNMVKANACYKMPTGNNGLDVSKPHSRPTEIPDFATDGSALLCTSMSRPQRRDDNISTIPSEVYHPCRLVKVSTGLNLIKSMSFPAMKLFHA